MLFIYRWSTWCGKTAWTGVKVGLLVQDAKISLIPLVVFWSIKHVKRGCNGSAHALDRNAIICEVDEIELESYQIMYLLLCSMTICYDIWMKLECFFQIKKEKKRGLFWSSLSWTYYSLCFLTLKDIYSDVHWFHDQNIQQLTTAIILYICAVRNSSFQIYNDLHTPLSNILWFQIQ